MAMKKYKKAKLLAKNRPTGSYSASCPIHTKGRVGDYEMDRNGQIVIFSCRYCEIVG